MVDKEGLFTTPDMMWPTLIALQELGGSGRNEEINEAVAKELGISEEQMAYKRNETHHLTLMEYRMAWARSRLKEIRALENSASGVWAITESGRQMTEETLLARGRKRSRSSVEEEVLDGRAGLPPVEDSIDGDALERESDWKVILMNRLLEMAPAAFERLAQRLLREAGFRNVLVVGRAGDGGIDGVGVYQLSLVSFPIYFQCKRYKGSVSSGAVRDFRGAMAGRGEKRLLITTGTFTRDARDEASRDGAPPVELISGDDLCGLLKQYSLGVKTEQKLVETVSVVVDYFDEV
jgi:restriction system protein